MTRPRRTSATGSPTAPSHGSSRSSICGSRVRSVAAIRRRCAHSRRAISPTSAEERRVYREAFAAALATLTARDRNLLRQMYLYGATVDELGVLYAVHRATAARWIAQIRDTLLRRTRGHIGDALRLTGDELD